MSTRRDRNRSAKNDAEEVPIRFINHDQYKHLFDPDESKRERAKILMLLVGLQDIVRLKDGWVERNADGEPEIVLYARCGSMYHTCDCTDDTHAEGFNEHYGPCFAQRSVEALTNPYFLRSVDCEYEATYGKFYFRAPPQFAARLRRMMQDPVDTAERWRIALEALPLDPNPSGADEIRAALSDLFKP